MKYKHFCHVDPQEPNITLVGLFIIQREQLGNLPPPGKNIAGG